MQNLATALVLSRGSIWKPQPWDWSPPLVAEWNMPWPDGASARAVFYDTAGGALLTVDGTVTAEMINFMAAPAVMDPIPAGANFEIFLDTADGPVMIRHGKVIRKEAQFFDAPASTISSTPRKFQDYFPTLGLRSVWEPIYGRVKVWDNSAQSLPNGVGPDVAFFSQGKAAMRYYEPFGSDSVKIHVRLLNPNAGKTSVVVCADKWFTSYLAVQFESDPIITSNNKIHLAVGSSPTQMTYQGTAVNHTVVNGNDYWIEYSNLTKTLLVRKGTDTTPLGEPWVDTADLVPHGPGYRYAGFVWDGGDLVIVNVTGPQVTGWEALDNA
ncbi:DUF7264 domain-containing protein [Mycobacteroides abscessus]|uniref:LtfC-like domain-containing protein n=1 Tax=Mycobacteroides abscessus TaxID=36809 RepID=UPI000C25BD61|nr:hypothetical protein [Mycobacteroides abscessus]